MSQNINKPKRFSLVGHEWIGDILEEKPDGDYVLYSDYADLAAENERLRASSFVTAVPSEEYERLKAENERLREAGDDLVFNIGNSEESLLKCADRWLAAKEGGRK